MDFCLIHYFPNSILYAISIQTANFWFGCFKSEKKIKITINFIGTYSTPLSTPPGNEIQLRGLGTVWWVYWVLITVSLWMWCKQQLHRTFSLNKNVCFPGVSGGFVRPDCSLKGGNLLSFENEEGRKWDHVINLLSGAAVGRLRGRQATVRHARVYCYS